VSDNPQPCLKRLDADCFRAHPAWAKQAFTYRLVHLLTPKALTKRLPKGLRRALLAPGVVMPPGVEMPPGVVVGPGGEVPPGWTPADPLPPGAIAPGTAPPGVEQSGAAPPTYTDVWSPGPVATAPPGGPVAVEPWFYDDFDDNWTDNWTDYSSGSGANTIHNNKLKMYSGASGDYAFLRAADDNTIPDAFVWTFELNVYSGTGEMVFYLYTGDHDLALIFEPPTTLKIKRAAAPIWKEITIANFLNQTHTWKTVYNGTTIDTYRDTTLIDSSLVPHSWSSYKGRRTLSCDNVLTTYIDDYTITPG